MDENRPQFMPMKFLIDLHPRVTIIDKNIVLYDESDRVLWTTANYDESKNF